MSNFLALLFASVTLWYVNVRFTLILLAWLFLFVIFWAFLNKKLSHLSGEWSFKGHLVIGRIVDTLSNMLTVRLFAREKYEDAWLTATIDEVENAERALELTHFKMWLLYGYGFFMAQCFNFYFLLQGRAEKWITVGDFALVLGLNISVMEFLWQLVDEFFKFSKLQGRLQQDIKDIMVIPEIMDAPNAKELSLTQGKIVFEKVCFQYLETMPLFQEKSVTIEPAQKVGLVGYSGSGKSTFVNLILRLYDVTSGRILIDDQDIREVTQDSLHGAIGMIPQDPSLFHRSLMDNIW